MIAFVKQNWFDMLMLLLTVVGLIFTGTYTYLAKDVCNFGFGMVVSVSLLISGEFIFLGLYYKAKKSQ